MFAKLRGTAILMILAVLIALPLGAIHAADPPHLSRLAIRLWPEFDKPGVLVFLVGQTAADTPLPAELKFTIPPGATINAIAYIDETRNVLTDQVESSVDGQTVSITTPNGNFHIEFYDPALTIDGAKRSYSYTWQQDMIVDSVIWQVEQPVGASGFTVSPAGGGLGTDENGLPAYELDGGAIPAGAASTVTVSYSKADDSLSIEAIAAAATIPPASTGTSAPPTSGDSTGIIIAAVILALAVVISAFMYFRSSGGARFGVRVIPPSGSGREGGSRGGGKPAKSAGQKESRGQRFCAQCGQPAKPGDQFCRKCGTKLRM
jgi:hypothetical protein